MDDLTQYLYEFLMERCMKDLREDAEYNACISAVLQQEEQVRAGLNPEQQSQLDRFIDQILELKLALDAGKVTDGTVVSMIAAGIGYTWAANVIRWG